MNLFKTGKRGSLALFFSLLGLATPALAQSDSTARGLAIQAGKPLPVALAARDGQFVPFKGDSLIAGTGSTGGATLPARVALDAGMTVSNDAIGGQTSTQIAKRMGAIPTTLRFSGATTQPYAGVATVTAVDGVTPTAAASILSTPADTNTRYLVGTVNCAGTLVRGTLVRGSTENYYFRATASLATVCPDDSVFTPDFNFAVGPLVFDMGRNDVGGSLTTLQTNVAAVFAKCAAAGNNQCYWLNVTNASNEPSGNSNYNSLVAANAAILAAYPGHVIPWREFLVSQYNPSLPNDVSAHATDNLPPSLQSDTIHLNNTGYALAGDFVYNFIKPALVKRSSTTLTSAALDPIFNNPLQLSNSLSIGCNRPSRTSALEVCGDIGLNGIIWGFNSGMNPSPLVSWSAAPATVAYGGSSLQGISMGVNSNPSAISILTADGSVATNRGVRDTSYSYQTPATGATITIADTSDLAILNPAATLAALTVNLPTCSTTYDGKIARFSTTQAITTLTVGATAGTVNGAPTTLAASTGTLFICRGALTTWFRL